MTLSTRETTYQQAFGRGVLVVANPGAAGVTGALVDGVRTGLLRRADTVEVAWTQGAGDARMLAADAAADPFGPGVVVAVGGDGTVREVTEALSCSAERGPVLLAVPAGSGNSSSRNLWGDLGWSDVVELAVSPAHCRIRAIDVMHLAEPGVTALLGTSAGFMAAVLVAVRDVDSALSGLDRYYAAAAGVMQDMPADPTRVSVDGVVLHDGLASCVVVGGGRYRANAFQFLPESELADGLLEVSTITELDSAGVAELAPLVRTGEHLSLASVRHTRGRHVVIERTDGQPLCAEFDGDLWTAAGPRLTVDVLPGALRVLCPVVAPCG